MDCYWLTVFVTLEQELAVRQLFMNRGWNFKKYQEEVFTGYPSITRSNFVGTSGVDGNSDRAGTESTDSQDPKISKAYPNLLCLDSIKKNNNLIVNTDDDNTSDEIDKDVMHQLAEIMEDSLRNEPSESYDRDSTVVNTSTNDASQLAHSVGSTLARSQNDVNVVLTSDQRRDETMCDLGSNRSFFSVDSKEGSDDCEESVQSYDLSECLVDDTQSEPVIPSCASSGIRQIKKETQDSKSTDVVIDNLKNSKYSRGLRNKRLKTKLSCKSEMKNRTKSKPLNGNTVGAKHKTGSFHCDSCDYTFKLLGAYKNHKKNGQCTFECDYCGKKFTARYYSNYQSHLKYHMNERENKCHLCDKTYIDAQALKIHIRKHTGDRPFVCDVCGKAFYSSSSLASHKHTSHPGDVYKCELCPAVLSTLGNLRVHKKVVHTTERPFTCEICGKTFKTKKSLEQIHAKVHMEVYPYKCEYSGCDKAFKRTEGLTDHMRRHNNQRSHFCERCGKGFYSNKDLQLHMRTHSGVKPYSCQMCSYRCALAGNLRKHLKTHQ